MLDEIEPDVAIYLPVACWMRLRCSWTYLWFARAKGHRHQYTLTVVAPQRKTNCVLDFICTEALGEKWHEH